MRMKIRERLAEFTIKELVEELVAREAYDVEQEDTNSNGNVVWYQAVIPTGMHTLDNTIRGGRYVDWDYLEGVTSDEGKAINDFYGGDPYRHPRYDRYCEEFGTLEEREAWDKFYETVTGYSVEQQRQSAKHGQAEVAA